MTVFADQFHDQLRPAKSSGTDGVFVGRAPGLLFLGHDRFRQGRRAARTCLRASTRPRRSRRRRASSSIRAGPSASRRGPSTTRRSRGREAKPSATPTPASTGARRGRRRRSRLAVNYGFANPHGHRPDEVGREGHHRRRHRQCPTQGFLACRPDRRATINGTAAAPQVHQPEGPRRRNAGILSSRRWGRYQGRPCYKALSRPQGILRYQLFDKGPASAAGARGRSSTPAIRTSAPPMSATGPDGAEVYALDDESIISHAAQPPRSEPEPYAWPDLPVSVRRPMSPINEDLFVEPIAKLLDNLKSPEGRPPPDPQSSLTGRVTAEDDAETKKWIAAPRSEGRRL